uniref:cohesin domain-containing protein n=1 Tax=Mariniphaga sp. TaxID=1954475 RepID=UPI00356896E6
MKIFTTIISILFLSIALGVNGQNAPITTLGTVSSTSSEAIVPVKADGFTNISSCALKIVYDPLIATPTNVSTGVGMGGTFDVNLSTPGEIRIGWYSSSTVTLTNGSTIFNIAFEKVTNGTTDLDFDDEYNGRACKYTTVVGGISQTLNDLPLSTYYISGSLTFTNQGPVTIAPTLTASVNDNISIPVKVTGFNNVGVVSLTLNYDQTVLDFTSASNTAGGFPSLSIDGTSVPGTIFIGGLETSSTGTTLSDYFTLFTLNFTYLGGTTDLSWNNDYANACEYGGSYPDYFVLNDEPYVDYYVNGSVGPDPTTPTPTITVGAVTHPTTCDGDGTIPLTFTNVPDGTYTITYDGGSFEGVVVSGGTATITTEAGTYNDLQITVGSETSAVGVDAELSDPEGPEKPTISASGPTTICPDGSATLTSSYAEGNVWSTGETMQSITVSTAGSYTVTVTNAALCSATSDPTVITVEGLTVSVSISASATEVCPGTEVTFTATTENEGTNPIYTWFVNNIPQGVNNPEFKYVPQNGDVVKCEVYSDADCVEPDGRTATSDPITMTVTPGLVVSVSISASATEVCPGTEVTFTATTENEGTNPIYTWFVNNIPQGVNNPEFKYVPQNGDVVKCEVYSDADCVEPDGRTATSDPITMTVTPGLVVSVSISASATEVCPGTEVTFSATTENEGTNPIYTWFVNNFPQGVNNPEFKYVPQNGDVVKCEVYSDADCVEPDERTAVSDPITMTVTPGLVVSVSISASATEVCPGTEVTFSATTENEGPNPIYTWFVNNIPQGVNNPEFKYVPTNGDVVKCEVYSDADCVEPDERTAVSDPITMTVTPGLVVSVSISASATEVCPETEVTFSATTENEGPNPIYTWFVNNIPQGVNNLEFKYVPTNGDVVKCEVYSDADCVTNSPVSSEEIIVSVYPVTPDISESVTVCKDDSYTWPVNNATYTAADSPVELTLTDGNGCEYSATLTINEYPVTAD